MALNPDMTNGTPDLGSYGIWRHFAGDGPELARLIESSGYGAIWLGGSPPADLVSAEDVLAATESIVVATGIVNIWSAAAPEVAESYHRIEKKHPGRFLLGIGVSHAPLIDSKEPGRYRKPLAATEAFLDGIDASAQPVPVANRVLAALGPKMLDLSKTKARGAHPYLTTPEHTRIAREVLGSGPLLLPEQTVLLTDDRDHAREVGGQWVRSYLKMPNYANNLRRLGFSDEEIDTVSDRLLDAVIAWGDEDAVKRRVTEHLDAGADHVCVQVLTADPTEFPREQWRRLAAALL